MGLLDGLLGKKESYPDLDPSGEAAAQIAEHKASLESLADRARDRLEAVPASDSLYVYIGKPPKDFGVVWYKDGEEHNLMSAMAAKGLSKAQVQQMSDALRDVYVANQSQPRYSYVIEGADIVVAPAQSFAADIERVLSQVGA